MRTGKPAETPKQWFGVYLGLVTHNRLKDMYVKVQVPILTGFEIHTWARPMGFTGMVKDADPVPDAEVLVPTGMMPANVALSPNFSEGPGPNVGTQVLVMFIAGDLSYPVYALAG